MGTMTVNGYGVTIQWDGETLRAKGTNKLTHRALMGQNRDLTEADTEHMTGQEIRAAVMDIPDELVLTQFTVVKFKTGNPITNGVLTVQDTNGVKYQLHFRRKDNDTFTALNEALTAASVAATRP